MSDPLLDLGDTTVNKIAFVLALSGKRDNNNNNKINTNAKEETEEGDRQGMCMGKGETYWGRQGRHH